ncbi:hypothetical protein [Verrucomicrobium sp. BvORR106]|uniref:hypothetical protein n=1 Tax=Verrucomicrobium sp. BvORR106 TaxID=1403819 RepID=UPI002240F4A6|nr:hypothetical protein [Verrucomicrobium sp. BvORR106]
MILAPGVFQPAVPAQARARLGLAWVPDYDEAALRDKACRLTVQRNLVTEDGQSRFVSRQGTLVSYDAGAQIAIVAFTEAFPYSQDGQVEKAAATQSGAVYALLPLHDGTPLPEPARPPSRPSRPGFPDYPPSYTPPVRYAPMTLELAPARLEGGQLVCDRLTQVESQLPKTIVVLGEEGGVAGFAMREGGQGWRYRPAVVPAADTRGVRFTPRSLEVGYLLGDTLPLKLRGELYDIFSDAETFKLAYRSAAVEGALPAPVAGAVSQPALGGVAEVQTYFNKNEGQMSLTLPKPDRAAGDAKVRYEVQVVVLDKAKEVIHRSQPFGVTIERRGEAFYPSVQGIALEGAAGSGAPAATGTTRAVASTSTGQQAGSEVALVVAPLGEGEVASLETESKILRALPGRGGRELLLRLEGAPYWKRISLEKRDWLPLPAEPLEECRVAANEEALFVLMPKERRLTRYDAVTLAKEVSVQVPEHLTPLDIASGAASTHGPVALICAEGRYACDPKTLEVAVSGVPGKDRTNSRSTDQYEYTLSGDGRELIGAMTERSSSRVGYPYDDFFRGFLIGSNDWSSSRSAGTVSINIEWSSSDILVPQPNGSKRKLEIRPGRQSSSSLPEARVGPLLAVPLYASLQAPGKQQVPPLPGTVTLYSLLNQAPVGSLATQEVSEMGDRNLGQVLGRLFFDPYSRSLAIFSQERMVKVRRMKEANLPADAAPVLLNFPDGVAMRGRKFVFAPQVLGPPGWKLLVAPLMQGMQVDGKGTITWEVPANFAPGKVDLNFKLVGPGGAEGSQFRHTLMIGGTPPVLALPATLGKVGMEALLGKVAAGEAAPAECVSLTSWFYNSPRQVVDILPGLNEYVVFRLEDRTLVLYSVKDRRVTGSYSPSDQTALFMAGDCVLAYEPAVSSLTRLSLPDFKPQVSVTLPDRAGLQGVGVGTLPDSPVSLLLDYTGTAGFSYTGTQSPFRMVIVEKNTLAKGKWAQLPPSASEKGYPHIGEQFSLLAWHTSKVPIQIPSSADGKVLCLQASQVIISPSLTVGVPYTLVREGSRPEQVMQYYASSSDTLLASPTGDRLSAGRVMYIGPKRLSLDDQSRMVYYSTCGNYAARGGVSSGGVISLVAADHPRGLVDLYNVGVLRLNEGYYERVGATFRPFGDRNLMVVRNNQGSMVQFIECDVPAVLRRAAPDTVMVTSHVVPFVAQGRTLEYKVTVNNPDAVATMRLRDSVAGAAITGGGIFTYRSPNIMKEAMALQILVEIVLKNGTVIPHEFPLNVIPVRPSAPGAGR